MVEGWILERGSDPWTAGGSGWTRGGRAEPRRGRAGDRRTRSRTLAGELGLDFNGNPVPASGLPLYALWGFEDVGIFFDYSSLFQSKPIPRTPSQDAAFKRALAGMSMW